MVGPRTCHSFRRNPLLSEEDELVGGPPGAPTKDSNIPTLFPAIFRTQTPVVPISAPALSSNNGLFQQFIKAYLEN